MDGQNVSAMPRLRATPAEGRSVAPDPGHHAAPVMRHGSMELRWFTPHGADPQTPHDRDELYFVTAGTGVLMRAAEAVPFEDDTRLTAPSEERVSFVAGDVLFVPAGTVHRFEDTSADFATWIVFYGPEGGERV